MPDPDPSPSPARGEVRAAEVLADPVMLDADWVARGKPRLFALPGPERDAIHALIDDIRLDSGRRRVDALLAQAPDAEGVAVMRDGTLMAVAIAVCEQCNGSGGDEAGGFPCGPCAGEGTQGLYRLTPPRREEQDR